MKIETIDDKIVVSGEVTVKDARSFPMRAENNNYYVTVDLSQGQFEETEEETHRCYGMSHSGGVYGTAYMKKVSALDIFLECLHAGTVILPANVKKRQLKICIQNRDIAQILVPEDCRLFSMKDGNIWNKKGTELIHSQGGAPVFVSCEGCGGTVIQSKCGHTVDGGYVCPRCQYTETIFGRYGTYVDVWGTFYRKDDPRLKDALAKIGWSLEDFL